MQHPDPDDLALLALGENLSDAVGAHVATCAVCRDEIESFKMTVGLAELSNYGEDAPQPGEHVWKAIADELGFGSARSGTTTLTTTVGEPPATGSTGADGPLWTTDAATGAGTQRADLGSADAPPARLNGAARAPLRSVPGTGSEGPAPSAKAAPPGAKRWPRWVAPLAAAVVGIAAGAGAVIVSQNRSNDVTVDAVAPLTPVPSGPLGTDESLRGQAELVTAPTGEEVRVDAAALPPSANSYEVWLFGDDGRMVSLGTLSDGSGTFTVPEGINTREYRVVDVSDEPPDGNPAHSGISLIRGAFS